MVEKTKVMTALVPISLFEEFNSTRKTLGRSIGEVQREMMRNWLDGRAEREIRGAKLAEWKDTLLSRIRALSGTIHHEDVYLMMYGELGGDKEKFSDAETILEKMRPKVNEFLRGEGERERCKPCLDEAYFTTSHHVESDWLRFEKRVRYRMQYHRLRQGSTDPTGI